MLCRGGDDFTWHKGSSSILFIADGGYGHLEILNRAFDVIEARLGLEIEIVVFHLLLLLLESGFAMLWHGSLV